MGGQHLSGLHAMVRDPVVRVGGAGDPRARQRDFQEQSRLCLPARSPDPAADLRSGSGQGADEAHQSAEGPRHRSEVRADQLGRSNEYRRRQDARTACGRRTRETDVPARPLRPDFAGTSLRHPAQDLRHRQLLFAQCDLRRSREDGSAPDAGFRRLPRLRPREDQLPGGLGLRSTGLESPGAEYHPPFP